MRKNRTIFVRDDGRTKNRHTRLAKKLQRGHVPKDNDDLMIQCIRNTIMKQSSGASRFRGITLAQ